MRVKYPQDKKIIELFLKGKSQIEIAQVAGCTNERIRQRLARNGITGRNYGWIPERKKVISALSKANSFSDAVQLLGLNDSQLQTAIQHRALSKELKNAKIRWKRQRRDEHYLLRRHPLITQVRRLALKLGHTPTGGELQSKGIAPIALIRTFGSQTEAMIAAGLTPNIHGKTFPLPPDFPKSTIRPDRKKSR